VVRGAREFFDQYKKVNAKETERMQETSGSEQHIWKPSPANMHKVNWDICGSG